MDTIIYFYRTDETKERDISYVVKYPMEGYALLCVGISKRLQGDQKDSAERLAEVAKEKKTFWKRLGDFWGHRNNRPEKEPQVITVEQKEMKALMEEINGQTDSFNECFFVYEDKLENTFFSRLWERECDCVRLRTEDMIRGPWIERQIADDQLTAYCVLGYRFELLRPLWQWAGRINSLHWYMTKRQWSKEAREFIEELEWEYGLIARVHLLENDKSWESIKWEMDCPTKIIDATGTDNVKSTGIYPGSVYEDLFSVKEKQRKIEERDLPIIYHSMKKHWKQRQKDGAVLTPQAKMGIIR